MMRRPTATAAASFATGIAAAGNADGKLEASMIAASAAAGCALLFFSALILHNYLNRELNGSIGGAEKESGRINAERTFADIRSAALLAVLFCALGFSAGVLSLAHTSQFDNMWGQTAQLSGIITEAEHGTAPDSAVFTVRLAGGTYGEASGSEFVQRSERIRVSVYKYKGPDPRLYTGCRAVARGTLRQPEPVSNPGGFDYSRFLRSRRILSCMSCYGTGFEAGGVRNRGAHELAEFKAEFEEKLMGAMDTDAAGLLCGILFGDDTYLDPDIEDNFRENGTGHLLAASGLHVGFVYSIVNFIFRRPRTLAGNAPVAFCLLLYAALAEFSPSVVRAVIMVMIMIVSKALVRRYDMINSISVTALILLIYNPAYIFSAGFQLSFLAVTTIAAVTDPVTRLLLPDKENIREMLPAGFVKYQLKRDMIRYAAGALAIQLGMMPVTLMSFHYISPAGFLLNAPSIALAGLIVPLGAVLIPLSFCPAPLFGAAAFLNEMLVRLLMQINSLTMSGFGRCIYLPSPETGFFLFYYFILFFLCGETGRHLIGFAASHICRRTAAALLLVCLAAGAVCAGAGFAADYDYMSGQMIFVDVGQGDCAHLKAGRTDIMFDSGGSDDRDIGKTVLMPYFLGNGTGTIDLAVISHLHTDHYAGLCSLTKYVHVKKLLVSEAYRSQLNKIVEDTGVPAENIIFAERGDRITVGGAVIEVLSPFPRSASEFAELAADPDSENDCSMVTRVTYSGVSYLFTGDIDETFENALLSSNSDMLSADVLKAAHHGSRFSSSAAFLEAVKPAAAVIQVGRNNYGHPTPEAMERISASGAAICRNDELGAVMIRPDRAGRIRINCMKPAS